MTRDLQILLGGFVIPSWENVEWKIIDSVNPSNIFNMRIAKSSPIGYQFFNTDFETIDNGVEGDCLLDSLLFRYKSSMKNLTKEKLRNEFIKIREDLEEEKKDFNPSLTHGARNRGHDQCRQESSNRIMESDPKRPHLQRAH